MQFEVAVLTGVGEPEQQLLLGDRGPLAGDRSGTVGGGHDVDVDDRTVGVDPVKVVHEPHPGDVVVVRAQRGDVVDERDPGGPGTPAGGGLAAVEFAPEQPDEPGLAFAFHRSDVGADVRQRLQRRQLASADVQYVEVQVVGRVVAAQAKREPGERGGGAGADGAVQQKVAGARVPADGVPGLVVGVVGERQRRQAAGVRAQPALGGLAELVGRHHLGQRVRPRWTEWRRAQLGVRLLRRGDQNFQVGQALGPGSNPLAARRARLEAARCAGLDAAGYHGLEQERRHGHRFGDAAGADPGRQRGLHWQRLLGADPVVRPAPLAAADGGGDRIVDDVLGVGGALHPQRDPQLDVVLDRVVHHSGGALGGQDHVHAQRPAEPADPVHRLAGAGQLPDHLGELVDDHDQAGQRLQLRPLGVAKPLVVADVGEADRVQQPLPVPQLGLQAAQGTGTELGVVLQAGDHPNRVRQRRARTEPGLALVVDEGERQVLRVVAHGQARHQGAQQLALAGSRRPRDEPVRAVVVEVDGEHVAFGDADLATGPQARRAGPPAVQHCPARRIGHAQQRKQGDPVRQAGSLRAQLGVLEAGQRSGRPPGRRLAHAGGDHPGHHLIGGQPVKLRRSVRCHVHRHGARRGQPIGEDDAGGREATAAGQQLPQRAGPALQQRPPVDHDQHHRPGALRPARVAPVGHLGGTREQAAGQGVGRLRTSREQAWLFPATAVEHVRQPFGPVPGARPVIIGEHRDSEVGRPRCRHRLAQQGPRHGQPGPPVAGEPEYPARGQAYRHRHIRQHRAFAQDLRDLLGRLTAVGPDRRRPGQVSVARGQFHEIRHSRAALPQPHPRAGRAGHRLRRIGQPIAAPPHLIRPAGMQQLPHPVHLGGELPHLSAYAPPAPGAILDEVRQHHQRRQRGDRGIAEVLRDRDQSARHDQRSDQSRDAEGHPAPGLRLDRQRDRVVPILLHSARSPAERDHAARAGLAQRVDRHDAADRRGRQHPQQYAATERNDVIGSDRDRRRHPYPVDVRAVGRAEVGEGHLAGGGDVELAVLA